jgi:hypothetical protein
MKIMLRMAPMISRKDWPKLGPFKKRSSEQVLWRVASDAERPAVGRWTAFKKLIEIVESTRRAVDRMLSVA